MIVYVLMCLVAAGLLLDVFVVVLATLTHTAAPQPPAEGPKLEGNYSMQWYRRGKSRASESPYELVGS